MLRPVVLMLCVLAGVPSLAQETAEPLPGPPETPAASWDELDPPEKAPEPPLPPSPGAHAADAEKVARDAYLGGEGLLGPLSLISWVSIFSPIAGGLAGAWASQESHPNLGGQYVRGVTAAIVRVLVASLLGGVGLAAVLVPAMLIGGAVALGVFAYAYAMGLLSFFNGGVTVGFAWLLIAYGGYDFGVGLMLAMFALTWWIPLVVTEKLAVLASDAVWDNLFVSRGVEKARERGGLLGSRLPGERPLNIVLAGALMAAAYGGVKNRVRWLEVIPLVGPWLAFAASVSDVSERMQQARNVAGYEGGADLSVPARAVEVALALLRTAAGPLLLTSALAWLSVGAGLGLVGLGILYPATFSPLIVFGVGLLIAASVPAALFTLSTVAAFSAGAVQLLAPWALAFHGLFSAEEIPTASIPDER